MPTLKLQVGLTDDVTNDSFVYEELPDKPIDGRVGYNLQRQNTDIERATVDWTLRTDINAVLKSVDMWEETIHRPHLVWINYTSTPLQQAPQYNNISFDIEFQSLLPLDESKFYFFQEDDFKHFIPDSSNFGDLFFHSYVIYEHAGFEYEETADYALLQGDLTTLNEDAVPVAMPAVKCDFNLGRNESKLRAKRRAEQFKKESRQRIIDMGFNPDNYKLAYGKAPWATLNGDKWEAYEKFVQYPRICRTSIIKED